VVLGESAGPHTGYGDWIAPHEPVDPGIASGSDDTCYQLYTSGTTGLPKGVELTNRNLLSAMEEGKEVWSFDADSVNLVAMPLFHISGSGWGIAAFYAGGVNVVLREVNPAEILHLVQKHRVTNALFVPAVLQILLGTPGVDGADFSSLRKVVYGASPISEDVLVRSIRTFGCGFVQVYGLTETTGAIVALRAEDHDPHGARAHLLRSAGKPWGDVAIRIVDPATGRDLPEGEVGEIWSRSAQNMKGYWRNPEATAQAYPEGRDANGLGWFRTGDAGYLRDGYLYIHDRVKDMIVSGGENVYPAEIENVLMSHPGVVDVAVIGVPSERWGETVKAVIVPKAGSDVCDASLLAHCRERLAGYKCPTSFDRVAALPRNPSGKLLKTQIREPYWEGRTRRVN
jgi:long-chain acyl-CoA synthetase